MNNRSVPSLPFQFCVFLSGFLLLLSSCSKIVLPRLEWEDQKKDPTVPIRVKLELDSSVQQGAFSYNDACGNPKVFQFGTQLGQVLREDSQKIFQQVVDREDLTLGNYVDAILQYTVLESRYDLTIPRLESDAEYPANASLRLRALLKDKGTGKELYAEIFEGHGDWKVNTDEAGQDCEPIGVGIPIDEAIDEISDNLVAKLRESGRLQIAAQNLVGQRQQALEGSQPTYPNPGLSRPVTGKLPAQGHSSAPPQSVSLVSEPSVQFRTKFVDANRNLVIEGGEAIKLLLQIQNVSDSMIPSAYVELRGTPVLIEAFKQVVSLPVPLGSLKPGEKRTAEIRGRLPRIKKKSNGELIVGIILSEGIPPGTHSIRAEIHPGLRSKTRKK